MDSEAEVELSKAVTLEPDNTIIYMHSPSLQLREAESAPQHIHTRTKAAQPLRQ
jgi:hypothetical protein